MTAKLTPGKIAGLDALATARGVIAALAMDQRGSLRQAIANARGGAVTDAMLEEVKTAVTEILTPYASAVLLDPEWGLPAARRRAAGTGLLLAYERGGYDHTRPGRLPDLLEGWSVRRLKEAGADAVKVLVYYTPFDRPEINDAKRAFVERIGDECRANDLPFLLECLGYDPDGGDLGSLDYARRKPDIVAGSMAEFSEPRYGVDVLKVEIPVELRYVEGTGVFCGTRAYSRAEALDHFRHAAAATSKPFIYLSAGVSHTQFIESLELAAEAGVGFHGVLCGRAIWQDGIPVYAREGPVGFRRWLETEGVRHIVDVNRHLETARPWYAAYGITSRDGLAPAAS
jgi:tagatose 1,6-diphosphate aldolase